MGYMYLGLLVLKQVKESVKCTQSRNQEKEDRKVCKYKTGP